MTPASFLLPALVFPVCVRSYGISSHLSIRLLAGFIGMAQGSPRMTAKFGDNGQPLFQLWLMMSSPSRNLRDLAPITPLRAWRWQILGVFGASAALDDVLESLDGVQRVSPRVTATSGPTNHVSVSIVCRVVFFNS